MEQETGCPLAALSVLATGVAALYLFLQANLTGCAHQPQPFVLCNYLFTGVMSIQKRGCSVLNLRCCCPAALFVHVQRACPCDTGHATLFLLSKRCLLACRPTPDAPESPANLFAERAAADAPAEAALPLGVDPTSAGDRWALARLAASGEEAEGRCALPQYLLLARTLLAPPLGAVPRCSSLCGYECSVHDTQGPFSKGGKEQDWMLRVDMHLSVPKERLPFHCSNA